MIGKEFKSLDELNDYFADEQTCIDYLARLRWGGNVVSPFDAASKVYKCKGNKYRCKNTGRYFNARTATIFDNTRIPLSQWFAAIYLFTQGQKPITSVQLSKYLSVTQKTAWLMIQRIKFLLRN
ncbi:transposase [Mucilaginibacter myungsuensis]|uniref:Transposase n=1 Tax=Mucilaginibacter myungsuensis TaxID=649104 RepID=A0A929KZF9_9SPHI|nr:transposase [Mucilaginibacter myungsuensis]MBE9661709.1 transposase [Mucilaginibacter myungsuensis]MDN3597852.1 hypothetical protein [Mucilaginibacter myungsuensis]